jgi:hypothetical protein
MAGMSDKLVAVLTIEFVALGLVVAVWLSSTHSVKRFNLRTLFVATLVFALALGFAVYNLRN